MWENVWFKFMLEQLMQGCLNGSPVVISYQEKVVVTFILKGREGALFVNRYLIFIFEKCYCFL